MSKEKEATKRLKVNLNSKFWRTFLFMLAVILTFAGPYTVYVLYNVLEISYAVSVISGFAILIVGLAFIWYLIKKKVIS